MALDDFDLDPIEATLDQTLEQLKRANADIDRPAEEYIRWPWPALDRVYGGMAPGSLHYVVGFSGNGKTTFIQSAIKRWTAQGVMLDVLPLETDPHTFRVGLACMDLGLRPGYITTGDFTRDPDHKGIGERLKKTMAMQLEDSNLNIQTMPTLDIAGLEYAARQAAKRDSQILVIDHIDHLGSKDFKLSALVQHKALELVKDYGLVGILMSQANNESMKHSSDRLAMYGAPEPNHVANGSEKRNVAAGMLGLYRPVTPYYPGDDVKAYAAKLAQCRGGELEPSHALWRGRVGVNLMKSRAYGEDPGHRLTLAYRAGMVDDLNAQERAEDDARKAGISTHGRT